MIGNILDNTTELYMIKYTFGEIFSSRGETLYKNASDQTVMRFIFQNMQMLRWSALHYQRLRDYKNIISYLLHHWVHPSVKLQF